MTAPSPTHPQFDLEQVTRSYWRVTFENGPVNLIDPDTVEQLATVLTRVEDDPHLTVVVFDSSNPQYFMAHWDLTSDRERVATMAPGPTGRHPYLDNLLRLSRLPVVTISSIRGRVRGAGSEFVLATDIRFAGDRASLGQVEVGLGSIPGGGAMARLARLVGRGRAMEILLGADDFSGELAERYGYVNRVLPDAGLDGFVDAFARRIAGFDRTAVAGTKELLDRASLPPDDELDPGLRAFFATSGRPENAGRAKALFALGLQTPDGVELDLGRAVGEVSRTLAEEM
ncbi:enoyl-CoA hydratase/isomerase family protein [Aeromicrobium sp. SMF47]|uniref:enoyl-CoA hydratase/isomerase family protein n=1 Tax=Aeromicrobium yanjiei TaxID=2662028 RepID=UPI00129D8BAE|nr:enoyl-CoA hydratase/isomerase family protein [Aeromicrobium yanjiei]MRJ76566.1 enoyl-CoA hydratase/isomerase family protein [Aeromicrobium yanjiei]